MTAVLGGPIIAAITAETAARVAADALRPTGDLGSIEVVSNFGTASASGVPIPASTIPVTVGTRPVAVSVSATLTAAAAGCLAGLIVYEDATIITTIHWTSPSAGSYQALSKVLRRTPAPGLHAYQAYLANFFANGTVSLYNVDPGLVPLEIIVVEL